MKILLSAYACEPNKGSEPGVGWNWARTLVQQGHTVHLITRANNRGAVEQGIRQEALALSASYYDLPAWWRRWKHWPGGIHLYYLLWQIGAYRVARRLHAARGFDLVHHVTFASFRQPSFMGALGIPFIFGPVGGGESTPPQLRRSFGRRHRLIESLRDLANARVPFDPTMAYTYSRAALIACTTQETRDRIPARYQSKCVVQPTIGIDVTPAPRNREALPQASFLYVGRLIYWKGLHLALQALAEVRRQVPGVRLRVIGGGEDAAWLKDLAEHYAVAAAVDWIPWMTHGDILGEYRNNTAFVFPSLHDSGGMVILEALAAGLPVICLNLGGPGVLVNESCGLPINARERSETEVVASVAKAMIEMAQDTGLRSRLAAGCIPRAQELSWEKGAQKLYNHLQGAEKTSNSAETINL